MTMLDTCMSHIVDILCFTDPLPGIVSSVVAGVIAFIGVVLCTLGICLLFSLYSRKNLAQGYNCLTI